jgi:anti-sigma factor RsiW
MERQADPVSEVDLCAYVDGQLDVARRHDVEDYLSSNPAAAADLMSDLRNRSAMQLAFKDRTVARADAVARARQLDRKLRVRRMARLVPRASIALLAAACLWLAQDEVGDALAPAALALPTFADEALDTHSTARLRQTIVTEAKDQSVDTAAIRHVARIVFPQPSREWRILDARLVPSDEGPGVQISFDSGEGTPVTFFAVRTRDPASSSPVTAQREGGTVAYWRRGQFGYALAAELAPADLARLARDMADNPTG